MTTRAASKTIVQLEKWTRESLGTLQFHVEFVRASVDRLRLPELVHTCFNLYAKQRNVHTVRTSISVELNTDKYTE